MRRLSLYSSPLEALRAHLTLPFIFLSLVRSRTSRTAACALPPRRRHLAPAAAAPTNLDAVHGPARPVGGAQAVQACVGDAARRFGRRRASERRRMERPERRVERGVSCDGGRKSAAGSVGACSEM